MGGDTFLCKQRNVSRENFLSARWAIALRRLPLLKYLLSLKLPKGAELCSAPNIFTSAFDRTARAILEGPSEQPGFFDAASPSYDVRFPQRLSQRHVKERGADHCYNRVGQSHRQLDRQRLHDGYIPCKALDENAADDVLCYIPPAVGMSPPWRR